MILDRFKLNNKTALITGGTRGIGLAIAHAFGEAGAKPSSVSEVAKGATCRQASLL